MKKIMAALVCFLLGTVAHYLISLNPVELTQAKSDLVSDWTLMNTVKNQLLTDEEKRYLKSISPLKKCVDPHWMPLEGIDQHGNHIGVIAEFITLVEQQLNIKTELVKTASWLESLDKLEQKECDIVTSDTESGAGLPFYTKTLPFISLQHVFVTQKEARKELDFSKIKDMKIGIPEGYPTINTLREKYGDINFVMVKNADEGVMLVSQGKLYAFTEMLPVISYSIEQQGLTNLKIAGHLNLNLSTVMAVRSDMPELSRILDKLFININKTFSNQLLSKWVKIDYHIKLDSERWIKSLIFFSLLLFAIVFWSKYLFDINKRLDEANKKLANLTETDALTQLKNRHYLNEKLPVVIEQAYNNQDSLGLAMLDIDHFKRLNDTYGHATGDQCLVLFSQLMQRIFNQEHLVRYGGEEFMVLHSGLTASQFEKKLTQACTELESTPFAISNKVAINLTMSVGYLHYDAAPKTLISTLTRDADIFLYQAKRTGRNKTVGKHF